MRSMRNTIGKLMRAGARGRKGSILVLVVAVIVLMTILGTSYLQVVRVQRLGISTYEGDIDAVLQSVLALVEDKMRGDLLDDDGNFFNPNAGTVDSGFDEPYDYPWVNDGANNRPYTRLLTPGGTVNAIGGAFDDAWIASNQPDFGANRWPQITNLTGAFVGLGGSADSDLEGGGAGNDADAAWDEFVVSNINANDDLSQSGLPLGFTAGAPGLGRLVDTDLDGMGDARWEFPPLSQIGGVIYVMAVRIVDVSAMLNVDAATGLVDSGPTYDAFTEAPRWDHPAELDAAQFMADATFANVNGSAVGELENLLFYRGTGSAAGTLANAPLLPRTDRLDLWRDQVRRYGPLGSGVAATINGRADFSHPDEWELRERNGLSDGDETGDLEPLMPTFLSSTSNPPALTNVSEAREFYGDTAGALTSPRPFMTVSSGVGVFAPRIPGVDGTGPVYKVDVNEASDAELGNAIADVFDTSVNGGADFDLPASFGSSASGATAFAQLYLACLRDYLDADNTLTAIGAYYGMERLPALAEVYVQQRYEVDNATDLSDLDGDTNGFSEWELEWNEVGNAGWAVELRNPFNRPIDLVGVQLVVDGTVVGGGDLVDLLNGAASLTNGTPADMLLQPDDVLVFYRDSDGGSDPPNDTVGGASGDELVDTSGAGTVYQAEINTFDWPDGGGTVGGDDTVSYPADEGGLLRGVVTVELRAATGATPVAYQAMEASAYPADYHEVVRNLEFSPAGPPASEDYVEDAHLGNTEGINALLLQRGEWLTVPGSVPQASSGGGDRNRDTGLDELGELTKGASMPAPANAINPTTDQLIIADDRDGDLVDDTDNDGIDDVLGSDGNTGDAIDDPMEHLGELALIAAIGPTDTLTLAEVWAAANGAGLTDLDDFRLDLGLNGSSPASFGGGNLDVPHAALLLERLTLQSPREDGIDNDDDGTTDEPDEAFVPGRINLNTASELVLQTALPIPDALIRNSVAADIVAYRQSPSERPGAPGPGIAYVSELAQRLETLMGGNDGLDTNQIGGTEVDFLADPAASGDPNRGADGVIDDAEERARVMSWLHQVASTRSDVFVAYILLKGFPADDPSQGAVESTRVMALFNRSAVTDDSSPVLQSVFTIE